MFFILSNSRASSHFLLPYARASPFQRARGNPSSNVALESDEDKSSRNSSQSGYCHHIVPLSVILPKIVENTQGDRLDGIGRHQRQTIEEITPGKQKCKQTNSDDTRERE